MSVEQMRTDMKGSSMKTVKKILEGVKDAFLALAVHIGTSIEINEDGSWDKHHARKNRKERKRNVQR